MDTHWPFALMHHQGAVSFRSLVLEMDGYTSIFKSEGIHEAHFLQWIKLA